MSEIFAKVPTTVNGGNNQDDKKRSRSDFLKISKFSLLVIESAQS